MEGCDNFVRTSRTSPLCSVTYQPAPCLSGECPYSAEERFLPFNPDELRRTELRINGRVVGLEATHFLVADSYREAV